ncbi:uncharacterized protein LOC128320050 [Pangasianodon hypophthalmus]|uniref:uncharacterized protein LOC128320050 n=1 Tax=Pangasianodon hypophthalmus TaxID=310915 RepID=UPI00230835F2|nr:uncharacterized protein LOC128320050 [Pangasianodon hypophthalmus]
MSRDVPKLTAMIAACPTKKGVGQADFYQRFVHNFSDITSLLSDLAKKGAPYPVQWMEPRKRAFCQKRSQAAVDDSERIFTELISSMEKKRSEVKKLIRAQEEAELSRAERPLKQLEQEIADLKRRVTELEQLSHTHDHIHFLQSFPSLCVPPGCEDSPSITVNQHLSFDGVRKSLSDLKKQVKEICEKEFNKIHPQGKQANICSASQ